MLSFLEIFSICIFFRNVNFIWVILHNGIILIIAVGFEKATDSAVTQTYCTAEISS
jgi:hypothetical protein